MSLDSNLQSAFTAVGTAIKGKIGSSEKGAVYGVATLDGAGKLTASQLPASAIGGMIYQGIWNASTNSPAIPTSAVDNKGHYYKVSVAGSTTIDTINEWKVGDWIVSNGSVWDKIDNTDQVSTVAGRTGAIVLGTSDITGLDTTLGTIVTANATTSTSGLMSGSDKTKLDGVATNANNYILPNASTTVTGGVKLSSDTVQGTSANAITSTAGRTYGVQVDATGKAVVNIPWVDTNTTYVVATTGANGLMSSTDKTKLDGIATGANNYTHPTSGVTAGTYKSVTVNNAGHITAGTNPTTLAEYGIIDAATSTHIHTNATTTVAGFMSTTDKTKLDGIATNANNYVKPVNEPISYITGLQTALDGKASTTYVDGKFTDIIGAAPEALDTLKEIANQLANDESVVSALTTTVSNKANATDVNTALATKVDKVAGKQLSSEDYTSADKTKLDGIATNANNYVKPVNEPISYIIGLQTELDSKATTTALNTEKGRIDAILSASTASTDTFAEIVTLINSVDTTNDAAFAGYVTSNNARSTTIETTLGNKVDKVVGKQLSTEDYTTIEKSKLSGIAAGAQVNVATDLSLGTATATTIPLNSSTGTDVTLPAVTTTTAGLMSSTDKTKLDGIATGANNYTHPTGDGNLHVPATSTTNNGKVLMAGATAGSLSWTSLAIANTSGLQVALDAKATSTSVTTLSNNIGATDTNYVTVFNAALV